MIVITDCDHPSVDTEAAVFAEAGLDWRLATCRTEEDVIREGAAASALLVQYAPVSRRVLEALPGCRVVGRYGVGLDTIDVPAARELGVRLVHVPDYCVDEVANHTIALILALGRGIVALDRGVHDGVWDFRLGGELRRPAAQRLGLIGLGRIGRAVADRARVLGYEVVGTDPGRPDTWVPNLPFDDVLATSDVVSIHCALTPETFHLVDGAAIARMKPGAIVVNTARGRIVDQGALADAIGSRALGGAALDVLEQEPLPADDRLLALPNVVITPHAAFYSRESLVEMKRRAAAGIVAALQEVTT